MSPAKEVTRSGMELYTKKGDGGRASTITRMNIPKNSPIFELLGTLDEFTSALGVAKQIRQAVHPGQHVAVHAAGLGGGHRAAFRPAGHGAGQIQGRAAL